VPAGAIVLWEARYNAGSGAPIVTDRRPQPNSPLTPTRIRWTRTADGVAGLGYTHLGTPPANPFISGAVSGTTTVLTVLRRCHLDINAMIQNNATLRVADRPYGSNATFGGDMSPQSIGGGVYNTVLHLGGVFGPAPNETPTLYLVGRNGLSGLNNLVFRLDITAYPIGPITQIP